MESPFKFLDAYTRNDSSHFMGRDEEIKTLYQMVFETPLVLIYGFSGTGKTSLVQCGLASKFDGPDWFPFFIRRNDDINVSLDLALDEYIRTKEGRESWSLTEKIGYINTIYFRPVYLIFDQLEELFIIGDEVKRRAEQDKFIHSIKELLDAGISCRVIFIIREEFLGQLYHFEKVIPYIFNHRLRVEAMKRHTVKEVITASCKEFNIKLEDPEDLRKDEIIDNISDENAGIQLTYLQVYLDGLYKQCYSEAYGADGLSGSQNPAMRYPPIVFKKETIKKFGTIKNVLEDFIETQKKEIYKDLRNSNHRINKKTIPALLDAMVTWEGTKLPVSFKRDDNDLIIPFSTRFIDRIPNNLTTRTRSTCISALAKCRIIRFIDNSTFELAHDSIAAVIDENRTEEDRQLNRVKKLLETNYEENRITPTVFIAKEQLAVYEDVINQLANEKRIGDGVIQFVARSREEAERREKDEKKEIAEKARNQQKIKSEKGKRVIAVVSAIVAISLAVFAGWQFFDVNTESKNNMVNKYKSEFEAAETFKANGTYTDAIKAYEKAVNYFESAMKKVPFYRKPFLLDIQLEPPIEHFESYQKLWTEVAYNLNQGDKLRMEINEDRNDLSDLLLIDQLKHYIQAYNLDQQNYTCNKIINVLEKIKTAMIKWEIRVDLYKGADVGLEQLKLSQFMIKRLSTYETLLVEKGINLEKPPCQNGSY